MVTIRSVSDFKAASVALNNAMRAVIEDSIKELVTDIRVRTPVDTSLLYRNWQVTYGSPATTTLYDMSGSMDIVAQMKLIPYLSSGYNQKYYVTNLVPYARDVEYFGSTAWKHTVARPSFMARVPIQKWKSTVADAVERNKI